MSIPMLVGGMSHWGFHPIEINPCDVTLNLWCMRFTDYGLPLYWWGD